MEGSYLRAVVQEKGTGERPGTASKLDQRPCTHLKACPAVAWATQCNMEGFQRNKDWAKGSRNALPLWGQGPHRARPDMQTPTGEAGGLPRVGWHWRCQCDLGISETGMCTALCVRCSTRHGGFQKRITIDLGVFLSKSQEPEPVSE